MSAFSEPQLDAARLLFGLDEARGFALADRYSQAECIRWAQELDAGVRAIDVASAFTKLTRLGNADLPCSPEAVPSLRTWFEEWSTRLLAADG